MPSTVPTPIAWGADDTVRLLDQTRLPDVEVWLDLADVSGVAEAIRSLRVRGAPLIGVAAAMGTVQALRGVRDAEGARSVLRGAVEELRATRPTAVNLGTALDRVMRRAEETPGGPDILRSALVDEADRILTEERAACEAIGEQGVALIPEGGVVCTVCNAGALATGGIGTATAPMYLAHAAGRQFEVLVPETRPLLQGSRLTAWELHRAGIACTVMADSMVASRFARGDVSCVIVGADRVAANGDVANKIGTYAVALAAAAHDIPFYVAFPESTRDPRCVTGAAIPIEERVRTEVMPSEALREVAVWNPAFDITPAALITGWLTPTGVLPGPRSRTS